jgi:phosphatidylglycerophosphatase C
VALCVRADCPPGVDRFDVTSLNALTLHAYGDTAGVKPMLRLAQHAWYRGKPWKEASAAA